MRKSLFLLAAFASLGVVVAFGMPAAAESDEAACVIPAPAEPIELDKIPAKPITGPQVVRGVAIDDECDDMLAIAKVEGNNVRAKINADDDSLSGEGLDESDD